MSRIMTSKMENTVALSSICGLSTSWITGTSWKLCRPQSQGKKVVWLISTRSRSLSMSRSLCIGLD